MSTEQRLTSMMNGTDMGGDEAEAARANAALDDQDDAMKMAMGMASGMGNAGSSDPVLNSLLDDLRRTIENSSGRVMGAMGMPPGMVGGSSMGPLSSLFANPIAVRLAKDEKAFHTATNGDLRMMVESALTAIIEGHGEELEFTSSLRTPGKGTTTKTVLNVAAMQAVREYLMLELFPSALLLEERPAVWHLGRKYFLEYFKMRWSEHRRDLLAGLDWPNVYDQARAVEAWPDTPTQAMECVLCFQEGLCWALEDAEAKKRGMEITRDGDPDEEHHRAAWRFWGRQAGRMMARENAAKAAMKEAME